MQAFYPSTQIEATCTHCGERFAAAESLAGGVANCPRCHQATAVPARGIDPFWLLLAACIGLPLAAGTGAGLLFGPGPGIAAGVAVALVTWVTAFALGHGVM